MNTVLKGTRKLALALVICFGVSCSKLLAEVVPVVTPTIFIALRQEVKELDFYGIVRAALSNWEEAMHGDPIPHIPWAHIVIIDEGRNWAVLFFQKENYRRSSGPDFYDFEIKTHVWVHGTINKTVYLDKSTLKVVEPPEGAISELPYLHLSLLPGDSELLKILGIENESKTGPAESHQSTDQP